MASPKVFRVALDTPLRRLFDCLPPASPPQGPVTPGMRVRVPLGRRGVIGLVVARGATSEIPRERLKPILEVLDPTPLLDSAALELLEWAAQYYHHPIGEVVAAALPKALRLGAAARESEERWELTSSGESACAEGEPRRAPRQRALLEALQQAGDGASAEALTGRLGSWPEGARPPPPRG